MPLRGKKRIPKAGEAAYYDDIDKYPPGCGYNKKFRYNVPLGDFGVPGELIHWAKANCKHKWGWHFVAHDEQDYWNPEGQDAYFSFNSKREAVWFWLQKDKIINDD